MDTFDRYIASLERVCAIFARAAETFERQGDMKNASRAYSRSWQARYKIDRLTTRRLV